MGKIAIWILVVVAVMLVLRSIGTKKRRVDDASSEAGPGGSRRAQERGDRGEERRDSGELMMSCAVCGIHVPASDAVFARGKVFCSTDHRDTDERNDA
jgi:uncharacterized protein